jgi:hypothetical protein
MPNIQTELRIQIEGGQAPVLIRRQPIQVHSCEQISLFVDGVKAEQPPAANIASAAKQVGKKKTSTTKPQKRFMQATYSPALKNVRFVAIYDAGQANGLRVKVGGAKFVTLEQPLVFTDRAAAAFNSKASIILENESALPRTAIMLVGSDLPKADRKITLVKKPLPTSAKSAAATAVTAPASARAHKKKTAVRRKK